jgi:hypothetical protein
MPQTATHSLPARRPMMAPLRELIWIQEPHFLDWRCSECAWVFNPSGPPVGNSFQEMKENYLRLRDEESAAHICAEHPRATKARVQIIQDVGQSLHRIPQRDTSARQGVARQGRRAGSRQKRVSANSSFSQLRYPRH